MSFSLDMDKIIGNYLDRLDMVVREVVYQLFVTTVNRTPKKTGRARANYFISPQGLDRADYDPMKFDASNIPMAQEVVKGIHAGGVVRIINNTPYIMALEFGYSDQAPLGFARLTVFEFQPLVDEAVRKVVSGA